MTTLREFEDFWLKHGDVPEAWLHVHDTFNALVHADKELNTHREYIKTNSLGMGDDSFHWMWSLIVDSLPNGFKFLEIGVHCGQVISLIELLAARTGKDALIVGVSPFDGREVGEYHNDYRPLVLSLFDKFNLRHPLLIKGDSTVQETIEEVRKESPFDVLFIDGSHVKEAVISDITSYAPMIRVGGLLVIDDCNNRARMPVSTPTHHFFQGIEPVSQAVDSLLPPLGPDALPDGSRWVLVGSVMHDRVLRRIA